MREKRVFQAVAGMLIMAVVGFIGPLRGAATSSTQSPGQASVLGAVELPSPSAAAFIGEAAVLLAPVTTTPTTTARAETTTSTTVPPTTTAPTTTAPTTTVPPPTVATITPTPTQPAASSRSALAWDGVSRVDYPWRERFPDWTVTIEPARDRVRALTFPSTKRVELYVRASDTPTSVARVFAHELGHVIDIELNSDADRQRWRDVRGVGASTPWWPTGQTYDFDTLAGDFAEAFAHWKVGASSQSRVGGGYTSAQLEVLADLATG